LTAPAVKLRNATHQFAAGDLKTRVGPLMGRRRDELADLGRDFDVMAERIESLLISERRLLGDISHELRSPLARLQLALDLAEQTADPETKQYLARIESEAEELNGMIGQLLTLTRLENAVAAQQGSKDAAFIDLEQLVKHVCENADFEARARGVRVELLHSERCQIIGNGELLHSAVENVVRNALLHAPQSPKVEVALTVAPHEALTAEDTATREAVIRVRDYGPGVPEESLQDLFRPFYRVAVARDRQTGGTGLGLSITERAVQFHGGTVTASNAEGSGLLVEIRLPLTEK
jgi:two-component system sensor histidine kinase CpxA